VAVDDESQPPLDDIHTSDDDGDAFLDG
jgi:hypothetical protein